MSNNNTLTLIERATLINKMADLLEEYDYTYANYALETIIDEWASQKEELITAFKRHPNYRPEEFAIVFSMDYERHVNREIISNFSFWVRFFGCKIDLRQLPEEVQKAHYMCNNLKYNTDRFFAYLSDFHERTISEADVIRMEAVFPNVCFHVGEKTCRAVNKICKYLGIDKHPDYNREYAKYADTLSPITIKRHTIFSLNPLDYLTMSFGNSWASCHTIDKANKRGMPDSYEGMYSSGTISYMLDSTSMVLYTTDKHNEPHDFYKQPKITRQMFHWGEEKLVQGRLYPQSNDSVVDAYTPYRNLVQEIMATVFNFPNLWTLKKGTTAISQYIRSDGTHYCDYDNFETCTISRPKESTNDNRFVVGADPICIECGSRHYTEDSINCCHSGHYHCESCGDRIDDEDDVRWINGVAYCSDCVSWCNWCNSYHLRAETYVRNVGYVCNSCLDDMQYCDECGEYQHPNEEMTYIENEDIYVCSGCRRAHFSRCEECGEYFRDNQICLSGDLRELCDDCYNKTEAKSTEAVEC